MFQMKNKIKSRKKQTLMPYQLKSRLSYEILTDTDTLRRL